MAIRFKLAETIAASGGKLTKNAIAVEAKVRPSTLSDLASEKSKSIKFETLDAILDAMNNLLPGGQYTITDIFEYEGRQKDTAE